MTHVKKQGTVSFSIRQPDPVNVYLDEDGAPFFCVREVLVAAGVSGTGTSKWVRRLIERSPSGASLVRQFPYKRGELAWFVRADALTNFVSVQPNTTLYARKAIIELAKAWSEAKKAYPKPKKREPDRDAPLLRFNTDGAAPTAPLVVNGWNEVAITV